MCGSARSVAGALPVYRVVTVPVEAMQRELNVMVVRGYRLHSIVPSAGHAVLIFERWRHFERQAMS